MKQIEQNRYAVVFPGQGSQYVGMGLEIAEKFSSAKEIFETAQEITNFPIQDVSFFGPEEDLMITSMTQPCLLSTSIACYTAFQKYFPIQPNFVCGHSVGEYAALVASGVLSFADAINLIHIRGNLMSKMDNGGMAALKGVTSAEVKELCQISIEPGGVLVPANFNSPEQIVISGDTDSIDSAIFNAMNQEIKVVPLAVSGAFHSPLMQEAAINFADAVRNIEFNNATIPIISNVTAKPVTSGQEWSQLLEKQIVSPVLWEHSIRYLEQQGINTFVEIGPSQVLSKLIKKIVPSAITLNVENLSSLEQAVTELKKSFLLKTV